MSEKLDVNKAYVVVKSGTADVVYAPKSVLNNIVVIDFDLMTSGQIEKFEDELELVRHPAVQVDKRERKQMETIYDATSENELRRFLLKHFEKRMASGRAVRGGLVWSSGSSNDRRSTVVWVRVWGTSPNELPNLRGVGFARCGPNDVFDLEFGERVAGGRAIANVAGQLWSFVATRQLTDSFAEGSHE